MSECLSLSLWPPRLSLLSPSHSVSGLWILYFYAKSCPIPLLGSWLCIRLLAQLLHLENLIYISNLTPISADGNSVELLKRKPRSHLWLLSFSQMPYLFLSVGLYSECIQNLTIFQIMVSGHIEYFKLKEFEKTAEAGRSLWPLQPFPPEAVAKAVM